MCNQLSRTYNITLEVPVQVTCRVNGETIADAMAMAIAQIGTDGVEAYHMSYDVMDESIVKVVEEV